MLDTNPEHVQLQQSNSIVLTPWTGSLNDPTSRELVSLIPFLEALAIQNVKDVRTVIKHYQDGGKHIPTAYAEAEAKLKEAQRIKWEEGREAREGKKAWIKALFGSLGGGKVSSRSISPASASTGPTAGANDFPFGCRRSNPTTSRQSCTSSRYERMLNECTSRSRSTGRTTKRSSRSRWTMIEIDN